MLLQRSGGETLDFFALRRERKNPLIKRCWHSIMHLWKCNKKDALFRNNIVNKSRTSGARTGGTGGDCEKIEDIRRKIKRSC